MLMDYCSSSYKQTRDIFGPVSAPLLYPLRGGQRLIDILDNVLYILDADGETHQIRRHTRSGEFFLG